MSERLLILGATSAIAEATARRYAERGAHLFLVARDPERLQAVADDLRARGAAAVHTRVQDLDRRDEHDALANACWRALGRVDIALLAHGTLPDQAACEVDPAAAATALERNAVNPIALLGHLANRFADQGDGTIAAIASVAGDRGRRSNHIYGTAKGALALYLSGLRARLHPAGVHVLTIKPGFVATPMTHGLALPRALVVPPARVARDIERALHRRRNTCYTPGFWRLIMLLIRALPEPLFKRLPL